MQQLVSKTSKAVSSKERTWTRKEINDILLNPDNVHKIARACCVSIEQMRDMLGRLANEFE